MPDDVHLILRDQGGKQPKDVRLRLALKFLLRAFGFRCIDLREDSKPEGCEQKEKGIPNE